MKIIMILSFLGGDYRSYIWLCVYVRLDGRCNELIKGNAHFTLGLIFILSSTTECQWVQTTVLVGVTSRDFRLLPVTSHYYTDSIIGTVMSTFIYNYSVNCNGRLTLGCFYSHDY